jgi:acyl-CoA thioester hydrolase
MMINKEWVEVIGQKVLPEWIDYNGHMNVAYYVLAFDHALDEIFDSFDIGPKYVKQGEGSFFVAQSHVHYLREVMEHDPLRVSWQLLDCDPKRLHYCLTMQHATEGFRAAVSEQVAMHVDMRTRRVAAMPPHVFDRMHALAKQHSSTPKPAEVGRMIGLRRQLRPQPA